MADTGWVDPGSSQQISTGETWSNVSESETQNDTPATVSIPNLKNSKILNVYNFDFGIPSGSTIDGILVWNEVYGSGANMIRFNTIQVSLSGTPSGDNLASWEWVDKTSDTDYYYAYGGATEMWNSGYDYDDISSSNFGINLILDCIGGTFLASVDHIMVKVYYTPPPGYVNDVNDVPGATIASINDVVVANIESVNEV